MQMADKQAYPEKTFAGGYIGGWRDASGSNTPRVPAQLPSLKHAYVGSLLKIG